MEIKDIILNQEFTATFEIRDSASGDTVSYSIVKASDSSTFASGSASWVGNGIWKVAFTPTTDNETYILILTDSTQGVTRTGSYRGTQKPQVVTVEISDLTASAMLEAVNNAILQILNGGGIKQYMIKGRMVIHENLAELRKMRRELMSEVNSARSSSDMETYGILSGD